MSKVKRVLESLDAKDLPLLAEVLENRAIMLRIGGELYGARKAGDDWLVWKLGSGDAGVLVAADYTQCSCGTPKCQHIATLKFGSDTAHVPWKYKPLHRKKLGPWHDSGRKQMRA